MNRFPSPRSALPEKTMLLPSRFAVLRYKLAGLGWILLMLLIPCAVGTGFYTMFVMGDASADIALKLIGLTALVFLVHWICALFARCPRCLTGSFSRRGCSRHGSSRSLLGSHRLRVAVSVLFRNHFRCPWCGELTAMKARAGHSSRRRR
jgi:hypothetical protein